MATTQVSEKDARQVAEAARETEWTLPSFGRELFLGNFRLDLIHPQPKHDPEAREKGERFIETLRSFLQESVDPHADRARREDPRRGARRPQGDRRARHQGGRAVRRPRAVAGLSTTARSRWRACGTRRCPRCCPRTSRSGWPSRCACSAPTSRSEKWLPLVAKTHVSAFMLTEPDVGSDPARVASTATPTDGGYLIKGSKLWATNGAIADVVVVMAKTPTRASARSSCPPTCDGVTLKHRNEFMGLRGIENSVTEFDDVFVPEENLIAREGEGLKVALATLNTGRIALPAICVGVAKWATKIAREWGARARAVGPARGQARGRGAQDLVPRRERVRARGDARRVEPPGRRQEERHPHRGRDREAVLLGDGLADRRRAGADPRRPRLRDRRVAQGARREAGARGAGAARHAHQPHLRGLDRGHAPLHRARGGGPAPEGGGRHPRARGGAGRQGQGRREGRCVLREVAPAAGGRQGPVRRARSTSSASSPRTCASWSGTRASWRAPPSTRSAATRPRWRRSRRSSAAWWTSAPSSTRWPARCVYANTIEEEHPDRAERGARAGGPVLQAGAGAAWTGSSPISGPTTTTTTTSSPRTCSRAATRSSRRACSTRRATGR